jgi:hypothetical protein
VIIVPKVTRLDLPEKYRDRILFKKEPIFTKKINKLSEGEKVYALTVEQLNDIRRIRSEKN